MRAIWSGFLRFGLVNIPVKMYPASRERVLNFNYFRKKDLCPIRYARVCRTTGEEVPYRDLVKGYEYHSGDYVILRDEDFVRANARKTRVIEIHDFSDEREVDPKLIERPFYLAPQQTGIKPYALVREAMKVTGRIGIVTFVFRAREHLGMLKPEGNGLVLNRMRFLDELLPFPAGRLLPREEITARELELARHLVDSLSTTFDPAEYRDRYVDDLRDLIAYRARGKVPRAERAKIMPTSVSELLSKLGESIELEHAHKK